MVLLAGIVLAILFVPSPWEAPVILVALVWEIVQVVLGFRWSQRRRARVGAEALIGSEATVASACRPEGRVRVRGELWAARCEEGADAGEKVIVRGLDGLTLVVSAFDNSATRA